MPLIGPGKGFRGAVKLGGDKSISHRLVLFSLLNQGAFTLENLSKCEDVMTSLKIFAQAGGNIEKTGENSLRLTGPEIWRENQIFDCGNSGTTARLLCGILAGKPGRFTLTGDASLQNRPMARITEPLGKMGAFFIGQTGRLPLQIEGNAELQSISYTTPVASAQVKSAIMLAALQAQGTTTIEEPFASRDHSERLLTHLGADIAATPGKVTINGPFHCEKNLTYKVPGDISSAAFLIVTALLVPGSEIVCENVLLNPRRTAFLSKLEEMGANLEWQSEEEFIEPSGKIIARFSPDLRPVNIEAHEICDLIDELPILAAAMAFAQGTSKVIGASELRVKESDRIKAICECFNRAGISANENHDGFIIEGNNKLMGGNRVNPSGDHRIAATMLVIALASEKGIFIENCDCINISFPEYRCCFSGFGL